MSKLRPLEQLSALLPLPPRLAHVAPPVEDLARIMSLPRREPIDCSRDENKKYKPATQALIEYVTAQFTRGPRVSCACQPRVITMIAQGVFAISRVLPSSMPVEPPTIAMLQQLAADWRTCREEAQLLQRVGNMRVGERIELESTDGDVPRPCILVFNAQQAWSLHEGKQVGGIVGFKGVGSGKCLRFDAEIFDYQQGRRRLVSESGVLSVASFDDRELVVKEAKAFPSGSKFCYDLWLADGSKLGLSFDHKVLTHRGWVEAMHLTESDFVAIPATLPEPVMHTLVSDDEVALLALLMADGACTTGMLSFTDDNEATIAEFKRLSSIVCRGWTEIETRSHARTFNLRGSFSGVHNGREGSGFRERWGLYDLSKDKRVSPEIWGLPRRQVALFLNRFWACDGHVSKVGLECTLASEKLIDDIRFLLLRLGVRSRKAFKLATIKGKPYDAWRITITGKDALTFLLAVGDVLGSESRCRVLRQHLESSNRNTNVDVVPVGRKELYEICDELGFVAQDRNGGTKRTEIIRGYFKATDGQFVSREKFVAFCDTYNYRGKYVHLGTKDLAWERVTSLQFVGEKEVYDLSVPETHNFVANNMIVHNTITGIMVPLLFPDARLAAILIEPKQRGHYRKHYLRLREHFRVPSMVFDDGTPPSPVIGTVPTHLVSFSRLSLTKNSDLLDDLDPDVLVIDEAHRACGDSAINRRVKRFCCSKLERREAAMMRGETVRTRATNLFNWSGTLENKTVQETHMLCSFALGNGSPLPQDPDVMVAYSVVLDPSRTPDRKSKTALRLYEAFTGRASSNDDAMDLFTQPEIELRRGFQQWRAWTPGIITASASSVNASIQFTARKAPEMPQVIKDAMSQVHADEAKRPDGEVLTERLEIVAAAREVGSGFYAYWAFPNHKCTCGSGRCEACLHIDNWYRIRAAFNKELRSKVRSGEVMLDSRKLLEEAAARFWQEPKYTGELPKWDSETWPAWRAIENTVEYVEKHKWLCEHERARVTCSCDVKTHPGYYLARDAAAWALKERGVVWFKSVPFGRKVAELSGLPYFNGGPGCEDRLNAEKGNRSIICSIKALGAGTDGLQFKFHKQLITEMPASNGGNEGMEQLLGRLHREGQQADVVETYAYLHTPELYDAYQQVRTQAAWHADMKKLPQRILFADEDLSEL